MKRVSKAAAKTLEKIIAKAEEGYVKIDNGSGGIMPITADLLDSHVSSQVWAVGHWYTQNGDAMRDPEVVFLRRRNLDLDGKGHDWFPLEYRQDGLAIHQILVGLDPQLNPVTWQPKQQPDVARFCHMWMTNVRAQQGLN